MIQIKSSFAAYLHDPLIQARLIRWVEWLLVVMLAVAFARLIAELLTPPGNPVEASQLTPVVPAITASTDQAGYSRALERLFGTPEVAVPQFAVDDKPLQRTSLNLVLKGILADQDSEKRYALIAVGGQKERVYRVGERIEGADILRIEPRRVVIRRNGLTESIDLEVGNLSVRNENSRLPGRSLVSTGDFGIRATGESARVIPKDTLKQQLSNLPALLQQASAVPHIDDGEQIGFRIVSIQKGSVFEHLGIRQDDIIYAVNGTPVRNAGDAMNAYRNLVTANTFRIGLLRDGRDMKLDLSVQ